MRLGVVLAALCSAVFASTAVAFRFPLASAMVAESVPVLPEVLPVSSTFRTSWPLPVMSSAVEPSPASRE